MTKGIFRLEAGTQGQDQNHSEEDIGRANELPVCGSDLLEAGGVLCEEAAAEEEAVDGEDFGGRGEVDGSQKDVTGGDEESENESGHFLTCAECKENIFEVAGVHPTLCVRLQRMGHPSFVGWVEAHAPKLGHGAPGFGGGMNSDGFKRQDTFLNIPDGL